MLDDSCCFSVIETDHFIQDSVVQPYMVAHVLPETQQSSVGRLRYWLHRDYRLHVAYDDYPYEANWSFFLLLPSGYSEVNKFGYLSSQSVELVP
jgi:hypothetical protein